MNDILKKGSEIELEVEGLAFGAKGLARLNGYIVFVPQSLPGQRVRAQITKKKKAFAEAKPLAVLRQSESYVEPRCQHFGECGGCLLQNLRYDVQLAYKQRQVVETIEHLAGIARPNVAAVIGSPQEYFYRNKMEFSFSRQRWLTRAEIESNQISGERDFALGLHSTNHYDKTLALEQCWLLSERSNRVLQVVREAVQPIRPAAAKPWPI
ncbi:hypothetical protein DCC62_23255 [candidate division KSB1 bacterium]|nr:MAG: hypothetical protein DCC62_23255 [candidate division KSB1 bacterium]